MKGSLIGTVLTNGELDFVYHHMNRDMQVKTDHREEVSSHPGGAPPGNSKRKGRNGNGQVEIILRESLCW